MKKSDELLKDISEAYKLIDISDKDEFIKKRHRESRKKLNEISSKVRCLILALDYAYSLIPDGTEDDKLIHIKEWVL